MLFVRCWMRAEARAPGATRAQGLRQTLNAGAGGLVVVAREPCGMLGTEFADGLAVPG